MADDDDVQTEQELVDYFALHDRVDDLSVATAQSLFGLRDVDASVAELVESASAVRSDDAVLPLRFEFDETTIIVNVMAGQIDVVIDPDPVSARVETASSTRTLDLDEASGATTTVEGAVRLRVSTTDGREVLTDPFIVPRA